MSEVIVRMEKVPKNCDDGCWGYLSGECPWCDHIDGYTMNGGRPRNCPIIGILPEEHGDLIDAVTAVRCKDCKWFEAFTYNGEPTGHGSCYNPRNECPQSDWFCADGERKNENE